MPEEDSISKSEVGSATTVTRPVSDNELLKISWLDRPGVTLGLSGLAFVIASFICVFLLRASYSVVVVLGALTLTLWLITRSSRGHNAALVRLKKAYRQERDRFIALMNNLDTAVVATDSNGKITLYNSAALGLLNTHASLNGEQFGNVFHLFDNKQQVVDVIGQTLSAKRAIERNDILMTVGQKDQLKLQVNAAPIIANFGGGSGGFVVMIRDITKQKSLDEERNEFVSVTSHELRTPIAVIEASLSAAVSGPMSAGMKPEALKMLQSAHDGIIRLSHLVKDLETLALAQGQYLDIEIKPIDPKAMATTVKVAHQQEAADKGINLLLHPMLELHPILTSPTFVHEILENYVSNAIKYTKEGVVSIGAENAPGGGVRFWVEDSGVGIGKTDQAKLFTKFFRAEDFHTRETEGTGLGLYIVKQMADRIGAKVWCISELGKGSIFFLQVPPVGALKTDSKKITNAEITDFASSV